MKSTVVRSRIGQTPQGGVGVGFQPKIPLHSGVLESWNKRSTLSDKTAIPSPRLVLSSPPEELWGIARVYKRQSAQSTERNWLVSGQKDHRYLSVTNKGRKDASGWNADGSNAVTTQR